MALGNRQVFNWKLKLMRNEEGFGKLEDGRIKVKINDSASLCLFLKPVHSEFNYQWDLYASLENNNNDEGIHPFPELRIHFSIQLKQGKRYRQVITDKYFDLKVGQSTEVDKVSIHSSYFRKHSGYKYCDLRVTIDYKINNIVASSKAALPQESLLAISQKAEIPEVASFELNIKTMFYSADNFTDLTVVSADGMEHGAHRFLLAARSPTFNQLLQEKSKEKDWDGKTLKLDDIEAKPLVGLIHWIYSGELHDDAGKWIKALFHAAIKYQACGLIQLLDDKLITICDKNNLVEATQLFELAKENGMATAAKKIAESLTKNINLGLKEWMKKE